MGWDVRSGPCPTCRGWSCMSCVRGAGHEACALDCPDCDDFRNQPQQPWDDYGGMPPDLGLDVFVGLSVRALTCAVG